MSEDKKTVRTGSQEEIVLQIVHREGGEATGRIVRDTLQVAEGRTFALTTAYTILERLEQKGLIESCLTDPIPERGGRRKQLFTITGSGVRALTEAQIAKRATAECFPQLHIGERRGILIMNTKNMKSKKERLIASGWKTATVDEFLELTPEESQIVETRLKLTHMLRERRQLARLTQVEIAKRVTSSQSRIAKAEADCQSVSLELLFRAILATGATIKDIGEAIASQDTSKTVAA